MRPAISLDAMWYEKGPEWQDGRSVSHPMATPTVRIWKLRDLLVPVPPCGTLAKGDDLALARVLEVYPRNNVEFAILLVREFRPAFSVPPTFAERLTEQVKG